MFVLKADNTEVRMVFICTTITLIARDDLISPQSEQPVDRYS